MKLYTEKQLKYIYNCYDFNLDQDGGSIIDENKHFEQCIKTLTPIELPSDEDIYSILRGKKMFDKDWGFIEGAKWVKQFILNQNEDNENLKFY